MRIKKWLFLFAVFYLFSLLFTAEALSEECQIVKDYSNGDYLVKVKGRNILAISEDKEKEILKLKKDLEVARQEIAIKDELLAKYEKVKGQYDKVGSQQKEYIAELEGVLNGYKELVQKYKKLKEPWFTVEGGVGATGKDTKPALLLGIGIRYFRVWGLLQESNSGVMVGLSFPLF